MEQQAACLLGVRLRNLVARPADTSGRLLRAGRGCSLHQAVHQTVGQSCGCCVGLEPSRDMLGRGRGFEASSQLVGSQIAYTSAGGAQCCLTVDDSRNDLMGWSGLGATQAGARVRAMAAAAVGELLDAS